MGRERAALGFSGPMADFDPAEWELPKRKAAVAKQEPEQVKKVAEVSGFQSREPKKVAKRPIEGKAASVRRRRSGRNAQFNLKAKPETIEAYCSIADAQGWVLGETLEKAVELLKREY